MTNRTQCMSMGVVLGCFFGGPQILSGQERILFVSDRDGNREIYAMDANGSHQTNLSRHTARDQAPAISPDGQTVAFVSDRSAMLGIWLMDIDGGNPRLVIERPEIDFGITWSPDARTLGLSLQRPEDGTHDVALLDLAAARLTLVTDTEGIDELTPVWSPDGRWLYYVRDDGSASTLVVHDLGGNGAARVISRRIGMAAFPQIAPDGRSAVLRSRVDGQFDVLRVDLASGAAENLTRHSANDWGASWSRDGSTIVFASDRDGDMEIYTMSLPDRALRQLTRNTMRDWMPAW